MTEHDAGGGPGGRRPGRPAVTAGSPAAGDGGLSADERAELERLRTEVTHLRDSGAARPRRRFSWRAPVASVLIIVGCVLAPLSVAAVWAAGQVSNTGGYVANVTPLISEPSVQQALTDRVSNAIITQLDVQGLVNQAAASLSQQGATRAGDLLGAASGPIAAGVNGFIHDQVATFVASPQAAQIWTQANRGLHVQMVKVLSGESSAITVVNGQATLNLGPFIDQAKKNLAAKGLTAVNSIPEINPTYPLFPAKALVQAQTAYQWLTTLAIALPIITVVLLGLGVYVARGHRRALIGAGLGVAASMLVLAAALAIAGGLLLGSLPASVSTAAAGDFYDAMVRFLRDGLRTAMAVGLIVAAGAFFTGPSVTAVRTRAALARSVGWIRASGDTAGLRTGPVGRWTYTHATILRISAVTIAALTFVLWNQPTGLTALVIAVILLAVIALIELIGRPPATPVPHA